MREFIRKIWERTFVTWYLTIYIYRVSKKSKELYGLIENPHMVRLSNSVTRMNKRHLSNKFKR